MSLSSTGPSGLGVNPSNVERSILETTVEVLDEAHDPGHFDAAGYGELTTSLHLPTSTSATPWSDLTVTSDDGGLVKIDEAMEGTDIGEGVDGAKRGELEAEVGTMEGIDVGRVVAVDGLSNFGPPVELVANKASDLSEFGETIHATVQVSPERLDLGDAEEERMHQTKDVEGQVLGGESANAVFLETLSDDVGGPINPVPRVKVE
ncbi:hypothetical protein NMY22_g19932 [Coprinellus aureogranulatus]|nr:hypothetical protein NMY22_g19932 [Coprinellus aureogranulatus]